MFSHAVLPALEVLVNSTLQKFRGCKMIEKGLKRSSNRKDPHRTVGNGHFTSLKKDIDFQKNTKDFQSHGNQCTEDISHP